jgi:hypothetical protein
VVAIVKLPLTLILKLHRNYLDEVLVVHNVRFYLYDLVPVKWRELGLLS